MLLVISVISANIIAPLITCFEVGFHMIVWAGAIKVIPFIWISVIALVVLTYKPAEWLTARIVKEGDSLGSHIVVNILCAVFLTVIGKWIGSRQISIESSHQAKDRTDFIKSRLL